MQEPWPSVVHINWSFITVINFMNERGEMVSATFIYNVSRFGVTKLILALKGKAQDQYTAFDYLIMMS